MGSLDVWRAEATKILIALIIGEDDNEIYAKSEDSNTYLLSVVDKLPVRNALVIILYYIDNLSLSEISNVLNISLVNAKVLLHRSRNELRELVIKHRYHEELLR